MKNVYICRKFIDMEIKRDVLDELYQWKNSRYRKPLVLQGARQVGKSFALKQFGAQCFENCCYVNLCCGGMPETIVRYLENRDWNEVDVVNNQILTAYTLDFAKHIDSKDIPRLHRLWTNIQEHLAKDDRKFKYAMIEKNARAREYENAVEWLVLSGLVNRVFEVNTLRLPLSSCKNSNAFKLYLVDSGLLRTKFRLAPTTVLQGDRLFTEFKGILTENYVLQSLVRQFGNDIFYWTSGNQAEIEFMFQHQEMIIPVEVKSTFSIKSKSLSEYRKKYLPELSVRFSLKNVEKNGDLLNLPLYLADVIRKILCTFAVEIDIK